MSPTIRSILAVVAGIAVAFVIVFGVEALGAVFFPPPAGLNMRDPEAMRSYMATVPMGALLFVLLAWGLGAFGGGYTAARLTQRNPDKHAWIVAAIVLGATLMNLVTLPHPTWFWIAGPVAVLIGGWLAARTAPPFAKGDVGA